MRCEAELQFGSDLHIDKGAEMAIFLSFVGGIAAIGVGFLLLWNWNGRGHYDRVALLLWIVPLLWLIARALTVPSWARFFSLLAYLTGLVLVSILVSKWRKRKYLKRILG